MKLATIQQHKDKLSKLGIVFVLLGLIVLWSCLSDAFFTTNNLLLIIKQVTLYGILVIGMTFVLVTGGIDLSVGSIVALSAVFAAHYCSGEYLELLKGGQVVLRVLHHQRVVGEGDGLPWAFAQSLIRGLQLKGLGAAAFVGGLDGKYLAAAVFAGTGDDDGGTGDGQLGL